MQFLPLNEMQTLTDIFPRSKAGAASPFPPVFPRGLTGKLLALDAWSGWLQRHTSTSRALIEAASSLPVWPQLLTRRFTKRIHRVHKEQPEASKQGWQSSQPALPGTHNSSRMGMCSVGIGLGGWVLCFERQCQKGVTGSQKTPSDPISC